MDDLTILDALQIAKAAEQRTADLYAEAAGQTPNPLARALFSELADFERHHYNRLVSLEKSLRAENGFISQLQAESRPSMSQMRRAQWR
jgi:rubrerythrin